MKVTEIVIEPRSWSRRSDLTQKVLQSERPTVHIGENMIPARRLAADSARFKPAQAFDKNFKV